MNPFKKSTKQISIFVTAGYPEFNSLSTQLKMLENSGIDFIEVGIPFSDPLADGPTIQQTSQIAIENGVDIDTIFDQLTATKSKIPLVLMGYINPVMNYGFEKFLSRAASLNIAGILLPDMSIEIYERFYAEMFSNYAVEPIFLITPNTEAARVEKAAELCKNSFIYLVSSNSTTGTADHVDPGEEVERIKHYCGETPLMIGFGIKDRETVERLWNYSDGVIIGSAYLNALKMNQESSFLASITSFSLQ